MHSLPWSLLIALQNRERVSGASNGDAGDMYTGLDRFGRVVDQLWATADTVSSGTGGDTLGTTTDEFQYGYDNNSNVLYKNNMVHSADSELYHANSSSPGDNSTAYELLNQLTTLCPGTLSASGNNGTTLDTVTTASTTNRWSLDALGQIHRDRRPIYANIRARMRLIALEDL